MQKRKMYMNMIQECCVLLWAKAHVKWLRQSGKLFSCQTNPNVKLLFANMAAVAFSGLKRTGTILLVISTQSKSLHLWWYIDGCIRTGNLHIWKGTINAKMCTQLLEQHMLSKRTRFFSMWGLFQQDNAKPQNTLVRIIGVELACLEPRPLIS